MWIRIKKNKDGSVRPTWFARVSKNGRKKDINLKIRIEGKIPLDKEGKLDPFGDGDEKFVASRERALKEAKRIEKQAEKVKDDIQASKNIYSARTGASINAVPLSKLMEKWEGKARTYTPSKTSQSLARVTFKDFEIFARNFAEAKGGICHTLDDITPELAKAYFDHLFSQYAWKTVKDKFSIIRDAWTRWHVLDFVNPFQNVVVRNREIKNATISRRPLTEHEIKRLWEVTRSDQLFHPLAVCAACTGMRIGDVCGLHWDDVDMKTGLISVTTSKTGSRVTIPIFDELKDVLMSCEAEGNTSKYVFPLGMEEYKSNYTGLIRGIKEYMAKVITPKKRTDEKKVEVDRPSLSIEEALGKISTAGFAPKKKERILAIVERFKRGQKSSVIAKDLGIARGQVSEYLRDAEEVTGETYRPLVAIRDGKAKTVAQQVKTTREKRKVGKHSASIYGWHSLRASFVVIAVERGIPLDEVRVIVGHSTADTTLEYFHPTARHTAERVRRQMGGRLLENGGGAHICMGKILPFTEDKQAELEEYLKSLNAKQKAELVSKLLN